MKNIETILSESGITLTDEQKAAINKAVAENYKTVADYDKQKEKLTAAEGKVTTLTESLDKFKDVDPEKLNGTIKELQDTIAAKDKELTDKIAERDFSDLLKNSISEAKGKNAKAIMALLDTESLKKSKNQKDDIAAAIKALTEAEDSKMLFDTAKEVGKENIVGTVIKGGKELTGVEAAFYKKNPDLAEK